MICSLQLFDIGASVVLETMKTVVALPLRGMARPLN